MILKWRYFVNSNTCFKEKRFEVVGHVRYDNLNIKRIHVRQMTNYCRSIFHRNDDSNISTQTRRAVGM